MFTIDFECEPSLSLPESANALRVVTADGVRARDLPGLAGLSREAMSGLTGFLGRQGCVVVAADPAARATKLVRLTGKGHQEKKKYPGSARSPRSAGGAGSGRPPSTGSGRRRRN